MNALNDPFVRSVYTSLKGNYISTTRHFAILKISISDPELMNKYGKKVGDHNKNILGNIFYDSGFDLMLPEDAVFEDENSVFVDFKIKTEMLFCDVDRNIVTNSPFLLHPRSSISKLPLMLSNHTGIIDSGYRGSIIGAFRNLDTQTACRVDKYTRLLQICHPSLCPIFVVFVDENELTTTERQSGGFGSTGIV